MFEDLDDPEGVPDADGRLAQTVARARRMRAQRRALIGAGALATVVLVVAALVSAGDQSERPVNVAAQPDGSSSEITDTTGTTDTTAVSEDATTTGLPATATSTTSRVRATTTSSSQPPATTPSTTIPPRYQFTAQLQPQFSSGAFGTAGADGAGSAWRITVRLTGLGARVNHHVYAQGKNPDGSFTQIHPVCQFTAGEDGSGGCTGTVQLPADSGYGGPGESDPAYCSVMGGDNAAAPGRVVADGPFAPS
ncbi:MAG: hypothetical protein QOG87_4190 [Actinomycetota bacterium]|jgi:hypothetical protein